MCGSGPVRRPGGLRAPSRRPCARDDQLHTAASEHLSDPSLGEIIRLIFFQQLCGFHFCNLISTQPQSQHFSSMYPSGMQRGWPVRWSHWSPGVPGGGDSENRVGFLVQGCPYPPSPWSWAGRGVGAEFRMRHVSPGCPHSHLLQRPPQPHSLASALSSAKHHCHPAHVLSTWDPVSNGLIGVTVLWRGN